MEKINTVASKETKILENYVLGILNFSLLIAGIIYLFRKEWLIGIFLIIMSFFMVNIILSLKHNRIKSMKELSHGNPLSADDRYNEMSAEEQNEFARSIGNAAIILGITAIVIFLHYGFRWYISIPFGILVGFMLPFMLLGIGMFKK